MISIHYVVCLGSGEWCRGKYHGEGELLILQPQMSEKEVCANTDKYFDNSHLITPKCVSNTVIFIIIKAKLMQILQDSGLTKMEGEGEGEKNKIEKKEGEEEDEEEGDKETMTEGEGEGEKVEEMTVLSDIEGRPVKERYVGGWQYGKRHGVVEPPLL